MNKKQKQVFKLCTDVNYLRGFLLDLDVSSFFDNNADGELMEYYIFPKQYYRDLSWLSAQYGAKFRLRKLGRHKTSGYNRNNYNIYIVTDDERGFLSSYTVCKVYSHELAHHIQNIVIRKNGFGSKVNVNHLGVELLSQAVLYERTAERLAYFICQKYFKHVWDIPHQRFTAYRHRSSIEFLGNHHFDLKCDIVNHSEVLTKRCLYDG